MTDFVVNGRFLAKPMGGVVRVGQELLRALIAEIAERGGPPLRIAAPPGAELPTPLPGTISAGPGFGSNLGEQVRLPLAYPRATILSFCNTTPMLARRSVLWIHDTHVFDAPETYTPAYRLWARAMLTAAKLRRFDIVTVSNFSRGRLLAQGADPAKVNVILNGADHILRAPKDDSALAAAGLLGERFVLVMGSPAKLKNMEFAIGALSAGLDASVKIATIGLAQQGPYAKSALGADPRVVILPMVSDGQLRALYAHARAVIVPSLLEGFGLYAAEAMFESAPLVLSNRGALPEVGANAALYFDPLDRNDLLSKTHTALTDEAGERLRNAAARRKEAFRWRRAARELIDLHLHVT